MSRRRELLRLSQQKRLQLRAQATGDTTALQALMRQQMGDAAAADPQRDTLAALQRVKDAKSRKERETQLVDLCTLLADSDDATLHHTVQVMGPQVMQQLVGTVLRQVNPALAARLKARLNRPAPAPAETQAQKRARKRREKRKRKRQRQRPGAAPAPVEPWELPLPPPAPPGDTREALGPLMALQGTPGS